MHHAEARRPASEDQVVGVSPCVSPHKSHTAPSPSTAPTVRQPPPCGLPRRTFWYGWCTIAVLPLSAARHACLLCATASVPVQAPLSALKWHKPRPRPPSNLFLLFSQRWLLGWTPTAFRKLSTLLVLPSTAIRRPGTALVLSAAASVRQASLLPWPTAARTGAGSFPGAFSTLATTLSFRFNHHDHCAKAVAGAWTSLTDVACTPILGQPPAQQNRGTLVSEEYFSNTHHSSKILLLLGRLGTRRAG